MGQTHWKAVMVNTQRSSHVSLSWLRAVSVPGKAFYTSPALFSLSLPTRLKDGRRTGGACPVYTQGRGALTRSGILRTTQA